MAVGGHGEAIATGLPLLVCAERVETEVQAGRHVNKLLKLRLRAGKMKRSVADVNAMINVADVANVAEVVAALRRDCLTRCSGGRVRAQSAY